MVTANTATKVAARRNSRGKLQRLDALIDLILGDPRIKRDAKILQILKDAVRGTMGRPRDPQVAENRPTLYRRYRGNRFPLTNPNGTKLPAWRSLTPWMKVQLATMALTERGYMVFKVHIHDDLREALLVAGKELRDELRNDLMRHLKRRFGSAPWFFFVLEEHTTAGEPTRAHAHGSIEVRRIALNPNDKKVPLRLRRLAQREGLAAAELQAGKELTIAALKAASGNTGDRPRIATTSGTDQARNIWHRPPYRLVFNTQWIDYAFKNTKRVSKNLGDKRLALPYDLRREAQRLWQLATVGEDAVSQWDIP
jgi:hypothetical protein